MHRRIALVALLAACSDDAGGISRSGVDGSKTLASVDAQELDTVCRWFADQEYEGRDAKTDCLPLAVFRTSSRADCEAEFEACSVDQPQRREELKASMLANCKEYVIEEECKATVAQLEACVRDTFGFAQELADSISCTRPMPDGQAADALVDPKSCDVVPRGCFP